jgi:succinate-acetate transporter protein
MRSGEGEGTLATEVSLQSSQAGAVEVIKEVAVPTKATGDPQVLGWLVFVVGSTCLGLELVGFVNQGALGAPLAIIFGATAFGLMVSAVWAAYLGQTFVAGAFGVFCGFWISYTALVLGLTHNWFGIAALAKTDAAVVGDTVKAFLLAWAITMALLTLATIRLPLAYTVDVALVDAALWILYVANSGSDPTGLTKVAGVVVFVFAALGAYIWLSAADQSLGGPGYPLGNPIRQ